PVAFEFVGKPEDAKAHAVLRDRIGDVAREPLRMHVERRRYHQNMRVIGTLQMRQARLRYEKSAPRIDGVHQIEAFYFRLLERCEGNGAGVVDAYIDAAEFRDRLLDGVLNLVLVTDIAGNRQRSSAGPFNLLSGRVDRTFQLRIRLRGLGGNCHVGPILRGALGDRQPYAATGAG